MNADRRKLIFGIGRCIAGGAVAALSARLLLCRRGAQGDLVAGACPACPWWDLCPGRSSPSPPQNNSKGAEPNG